MPHSLVAFLHKTPYFARIADDELDRIAEVFVVRDFERDAYLYMEGDPAHWGGIIMSGQVKLIKHSDTGKDLAVEVLGPNRFLGIESMLGDEMYVSTAQAMEDTQICVLSAQASLRLLEGNADTSVAVTRDLSQRLQEAYQMMRSLALERVERRVALNLVKLAGKMGISRPDGSILIDLPLSRQDIADMAGTTIETAIRTMSKFQKQDLVESVDGKVILLKPHKMVMISEDLV